MSKSFEPAPQGQKVEGDLLMTIECTLPEGVTLGKTPYGMGVFATKHFKKGDLIYRGYYVTINKPPAGSSNQIALKTPIGEFPMDVTMHTVEQPDGRRQLFYFDGYMNHSCDPTTISVDPIDEENGGSYGTEALRDIVPGEELTADYDLFEWDNRDKGIDKCGCGSTLCRGFAHGFKFLTPELQAKMLPLAFNEVRVWYEREIKKE